MKKIAVVALAMLLPHSVAFAGVATDVLNVTAQISTGAGECTVSVVSHIDFGTSDGTVGMQAQGEIAVQCPPDLTYHVGFDAGQHYNGSIRALELEGGSSLIRYDLWHGDSDPWGDGGQTHWAPAYSGYGTGSPEIWTVRGSASTIDYGPPPDGLYSDIVQVKVGF